MSCGLWMARYVQGNLQERELSAVNTLMKTWAASSNMITFSVLGISAVSLYHNWDWVFISVTIGAIVVARFVGKLCVSIITKPNMFSHIPALICSEQAKNRAD